MLKPRPLCPEEKALPYAKYYDIPFEGMRPGDEALVAQPLNAEDTLPVERAVELVRLDGGYVGHDVGYCVLPDGRTYTACMEQLPGVTPAMMDWFFKWMGHRPASVPQGNGNLRYKLWCPIDHWDLVDLYDEPALGAEFHESLDLYHEAPMIHMHVRRFPLSVVGVTEEMKARMDREGYFMALECGYSVNDEPGGFGINFFRPIPGGCEWISRSWGGYTIRDGRIVELPVGTPPAYDSMRTELIHNLAERRHLCKVLPPLYAEYGHKPFDAEA